MAGVLRPVVKLVVLICLLQELFECLTTKNVLQTCGETMECIFSPNLAYKEKLNHCTNENPSRVCQHRKHRRCRKRFLSTRIIYCPNGLASFQVARIATSGDVSPSPEPLAKSINRPKCLVCNRTIARNHRTINCSLCNLLCHIKCGGVSPAQYKDIVSGGSVTNWSCSECVETLNFLPFANVSNLEDELNNSDMLLNLHSISRSGSSMDSITDPLESMIQIKQTHHNQDLLLHLNINSLQNKFEELKLINDKLKASVIILTETKIDSTYPDSQFKLNNYRLFRNDRVKGGGGVLAYVGSGISSKRLKLPKVYDTLNLLF